MFTRARPPSSSGPRPLSSLRPGEAGIIVGITSPPERLVKLSSLGVMPGVRVLLVQRHPAIVLQIAETSIALDGEVAKDILVNPAAGQSGP